MYTFIKYIGFALGMALFVFTAQAKEIQFIKGDFEAAKAKAKEERKLIFVDAYAVWCGPCKMMDRNTFNNERVAAYFNENFVNLKIDVEKGQGPIFASKYQITGMPTLLFLDYNGEIVSRELGYRGPNELMQAAKSADSPENTSVYYSLAYEEGSNDPEILYNYSLILAKQDKDFHEAAARYFATQSDKDLYKNPQNWEAIRQLTTDIDSREFQYLLKKKKKFEKNFGAQAVDEKIKKVLKETVLKAAILRKEEEYLKAVLTAQSELKDDDRTANRLKMVYAEATNDWTNYAQKAAYHFDTYTVTDAKLLAEAARLVHKHTNNMEFLEKAISWTRQSIAIENEYYNNNILAHLYFSSGNLMEASKTAHKALKIAELKQIDGSEAQGILDAINHE